MTEKRKEDRPLRYGPVMVVVIIVVEWLVFALPPKERFVPTAVKLDGSWAMILAALILAILYAAWSPSKYLTVLYVAFGGMLIIVYFAGIYFTIGSVYGGFGNPQPTKLTHIDALYFTLGTFTTAGSGTLAPITQGARALVAVQNFIDLLYVVIVLGLTVSRMASSPFGLRPAKD